jgi:hypothetical protein
MGVRPIGLDERQCNETQDNMCGWIDSTALFNPILTEPHNHIESICVSRPELRSSQQSHLGIGGLRERDHAWHALLITKRGPSQCAACVLMQLRFQSLLFVLREILTFASAYVARFCTITGVIFLSAEFAQGCNRWFPFVSINSSSIAGARQRS